MGHEAAFQKDAGLEPVAQRSFAVLISVRFSEKETPGNYSAELESDNFGSALHLGVGKDLVKKFQKVDGWE